MLKIISGYLSWLSGNLKTHIYLEKKNWENLIFNEKDLHMEFLQVAGVK